MDTENPTFGETDIDSKATKERFSFTLFLQNSQRKGLTDRQEGSKVKKKERKKVAHSAGQGKVQVNDMK